MQKDKVVIASVVRDRAMYDACLGNNSHTDGCEMFILDNTSENMPVTFRYNRFLDELSKDGEDCWIVLCHEDWEPREDIPGRLDCLDRNFLYGPIGSFTLELPRVDVIMNMGYVLHCSRNGKKESSVRGKQVEGRADTFDCQCIIMHSSLVRQYGLRFDENLHFHMYVEDFCISAYERFGIESRTIALLACHHSKGSLSKEFHEALSYERKKFAVSKKRYSTIVGHENTIGGDQSKRKFKWKRSPIRYLRFNLGI